MVRKIRNKPAIAVSGARKVHRDASLIVIACEGEKTEAFAECVQKEPACPELLSARGLLHR